MGDTKFCIQINAKGWQNRGPQQHGIGNGNDKRCSWWYDDDGKWQHLLNDRME